MSRAPLENIDMTEACLETDADTVVGNHKYPPRSSHNHASRGESSFVDSSSASAPIFSTYLEMAEEEDKKRAESWKADAEGILVFTGLFSAAVASLISVSIQDIQQNPQAISNFYLSNIYQVIADPNRSNISTSLPASPPPFSPPNYAVWVNSLWFLSLAISLTCALLATLLQQWARRYLKVTQTRYNLHKRARIRSFFAEGVENSLLLLAVEALPTLIHVSLSLFFAGLVLFLWNVNLTIFKLVLSWVGVCTAFYGCVTFIPIFRHDSPYYTPLTLLARPVVFAILSLLRALYICLYPFVSSCTLCFCWSGPVRIFGYLGVKLEQVLDWTRMTPEEAALKVPSEIDTRAFMWTFDRLDEDHELEGFFSGLPGCFDNSEVLKEPLRCLNHEQTLTLLEAAIRLLDRTFSSNLLLDRVKRRRADICAKAIKLLDTPKAFPEILRRLASEVRYGPLQSTEIVHFIRRWGIGKSEDVALDQAIFCIVVARVQQHDDSWFILASNELGIPETVLRQLATHGDNLSLAMLIYVTRQQFIHFRNTSWPFRAISKVLGVASKFDVQDTSLELQHEFCALWNQVARTAQYDNGVLMARHILRRIRNLYIDLHKDTDSAPTRFSPSTGDDDINLYDPYLYPVCNTAGHIHDDSASTSRFWTDPHDGPPLFPASLASSVAHSIPLPASFHIDKSFTTPPLLDNSRPTHQTAESFRVPMISPVQARLDAVQDIVTSVITTSYPTPETSLSASPLSPTSPTAANSFQRNMDLLVHPNSPNPPSSASNPVLYNILPTESYHFITVTTAPSAYSGPTSSPDLDAAAEGDHTPIPALRKEKDSLEPPILDLPPQPPSLTSVTDLNVAIATPSREPNVERAGGHKAHTSDSQYDIV